MKKGVKWKYIYFYILYKHKNLIYNYENYN